MTTIELKHKQLSDIIDNSCLIKMILNYSIEKSSDIFLGIMKLRKRIQPLEYWDKYIKYSLIIKKRTGRKIGFIMELKRDDKKEFCMHSIYIIPEQRKKGYCNQVLEIYSKTSGCIIADEIMTKIIEKSDEYLLHPRPNKDGSRNFYTKSHPVYDKFMNLCNLMHNLKNYQSNLDAHKPLPPLDMSD